VFVSAPTDGCAAGTQSRRIRGSRSPVRRNTIAACWTALRVWATVLHGLAQIVLLFPRLSKSQRDVRVQIWARTVLKRLGVELTVSGTPARVGPMLLVSNHISWLDIVALHAVCHCRFVSKADVKRWPIIGTLATGGGTLYVERESRRDAMRMGHRMAQALRDGDILAVFPEGTTGDGTSVLPFHSNLIQAAISADAPVQPVALQFLHGCSGRATQDVSYMGDESLVGSIWRTLCARELRAVVVFGTPQRAEGRDRRAWAQALRSEITAMRQA
jgi:1-acyl-sn-glycerol-3-phosphate acyltransferase